MTFSSMNLDPLISKALEACGYTTPTPIQSRAIPEILAGKDIVASAQTGTGKTAAFVLPALHRLSLTKSNGNPRVLILTPTRELATQITQAATTYGKFMRFSIVSLVGGMPYRQQLRDLSRPMDIIVATPGRLLDHMDNKRLNLSGIEMLVLDEADRMLDMGFIDDVSDIAKKTPNTRQTLLFSATVDNKLGSVVRQLLKDPSRIDLSNAKLSPPKIKQEIYISDNSQHKTRLLNHFLENENIFKGIIFTATKVNADVIAKQLCHLEYEAAALHGDLKQQVRNKTIEKFRNGRVQFLVATDVAARGIDINDVTHVFNYDLPKFAEDYVHRIGRTGRAGKEGIAISLVLPLDGRHLQKIEKYIGQKLDFCTVEGLEPTKRMSSAKSEGPGRKRFGGGDGSGYKKKKDARGSYARSSDSHYGKKEGDAKKRYYESSDAKSSDRKRSFKKADERPTFKRSDDRKESGFRHDDRRPSERTVKSTDRDASFKRTDEKRTTSSEPRSFKRADNRTVPFKRNDERKTSGFRSESRSTDRPVKKFEDRRDAPRSFRKPDDSKRPGERTFKKPEERSFKRNDDKRDRPFTSTATTRPVRERRVTTEGRSAASRKPFHNDAKIPFAKSKEKRERVPKVD